MEGIVRHLQTSRHRWFGFFVLVWFFKGLKAGGVFHSMLILFKSSPIEWVFSLVNKNLHHTQHTHSCLQRQTSTLNLLIETRIKIIENHFSSDFISGAFLIIISFIPHIGCRPVHKLSAYLTHKKERLKVILGHS